MAISGDAPCCECSFGGGASGAVPPPPTVDVDYRASLEPEAEESWVAISQGVREAGFKAELRYELVADVALSISSLAEAEAQEPPVQLPPSDAGIAVAASAADTTRQTRHCPSRNSVGATGDDTPTTPVRGDPPAGSPLCSPWMQRNSPAAESSMGPMVASARARAHYAVAHFPRDTRGVRDLAEVIRCRVRLIARRPVGTAAAARVRVGGRIGSFFYWVKNADGSDTGFIVKQITKAEKDVLMHILPAYKAHVQARRGASLLQYLSCHAMRLRWKWSGKVYFVVMRNFFPRARSSFDLKGATANRRALKTWELPNEHRRRPIRHAARLGVDGYWDDD